MYANIYCKNHILQYRIQKCYWQQTSKLLVIGKHSLGLAKFYLTFLLAYKTTSSKGHTHICYFQCSAWYALWRQTCLSFEKQVPSTLKVKVCFCRLGLYLRELTGFVISLAFETSFEDVVQVFSVFLLVWVPKEQLVYSCSSGNFIVQCFVHWYLVKTVMVSELLHQSLCIFMTECHLEFKVYTTGKSGIVHGNTSSSIAVISISHVIDR
jgi:hypothetical protein